MRLIRWLAALAALALVAACGGGRGGGDSGGGKSQSVAFSCASRHVLATIAGTTASAALVPQCNAPPTSCTASPATATCGSQGGQWVVTGSVAGDYTITWGHTASAGVAAGTWDGGKVTVAARSTALNQVPLVVDAGPVEFPSGTYNRLYVDVTVCKPGSATQCVTVDHVAVDTGSIGLRLFDSDALDALGLDTVVVGGAEAWSCQQYGASESWGSLKTVDVRMGGELAAAIPIQLMNDPARAIPAACSAIGLVNTAANFNGKGLLGLKNTGIGIQQGGLTWYACNSGGCSASTPAQVAATPNITNPVAAFGADANGVIVQLQSVPAMGATSATGTLTFGIGTQDDNALAGVTVIPTDGYTVRTTWQGVTYQSVLDTGTGFIILPSMAAPYCGDSTVYCPATTQTLSAAISGIDSTQVAVTFDVANYFQLFGQADRPRALDDIAMYIDFPDAPVNWGLPFFFGRSVYIAYTDAATPSGNAPFVAF